MANTRTRSSTQARDVPRAARASWLLGVRALSATQMGLVIDEDTIGDAERNHTTEQVGYIVFQSPVTVP